MTEHDLGAVSPAKWEEGYSLDSVNWDKIPDRMDLDIWNRLVSNFWVPEKIPVSNDIGGWEQMTDAEKNATLKVFTGLTMLDTMQGTVGAVSLIPDAASMHEEAVLSNIVFMEALSADTKLLTPNGWKDIHTVTEGDKVAQYDPENGEISFVTPEVVEPHFSEEVYEIAAKNGNARQVVSGGHRVYLEEKVTKTSSCKEWKHTVHEARDLGGVNLDTAFRRFRVAGKAPSGEGMSAEDRLLVAVNADGSFKAGSSPRYTGEKTGSIPCSFSFSKQRKIDRMTHLAEEAGWELSEGSPSGSKRNFYLMVPVGLVGDRSKKLNGFFSLESVTFEFAVDFIEEISLWDGHQKGGSGVSIHTTVEEDSEFITAVATLAGKRARTTLRVDDRSDRFSDTWMTYIADTAHVGGQSMEVKRAEDQMVYCVKVPSTFLVTKNGATPVISGNCVHAKSYSNIFMTLASTPEIEQAFRWSRTDENIQKKGQAIMRFYRGGDPLKRKIASVMLESFLFYSGFYLPLRFASHSKLSNTADIIRLIIRDECLTAAHELLTPNGWKPIAEVTTDDLVAQWNEDGSIEFVHPVATSSHFAEKTYLFETSQGHIRQHVSPGHRMLTQRRSYAKGSDDWENEVILAEDYPQSRLNPYARFIGAGELEGAARQLSAEERLLIAIQADGNFDTTTKNQNGELRRSGVKTGTVPAKFTISKERKFERLTQLANEAGWKLRVGSIEPEKGNVKEKKNLILYVPVEFPRNKRLISIARLDEVSADWCRDFIAELSLWDGHIVKENPERITWSSTVEENAKYVQAVASLAGYRTHYRKIEDGRSDSFQDIHRVQIHTGLGTYGAQKVIKTELPGEQVYGVQVPSTFLLTRNGGSVNVTGNSIHGYYIGYKFQQEYKKQSPERQEELADETLELLLYLYENEENYTNQVYDDLGWSEDVKGFLRYNANKAMMNLGFDPVFDSSQVKFNNGVRTSLDPSSNENHDFFSGSGSSYVIGDTEETSDDDWNW